MKGKNLFIATLVILLLLQSGYIFYLKGFLPFKRRKFNPSFQENPSGGRGSFSWEEEFLNNWERDFFDEGQDIFQDIFKELQSLRKRLKGMLRERLDFNLRGKDFFSGTKFFEPDIDIKEEDTHYLIVVDLPGMDKDKINVEIKDRALRISGERQTFAKENKDNFFKQERSYGHFLRLIPLPPDINEEDVSAEYKNGVLSIKIGNVDTAKTIKGKRVEVF